jgi:hypothetical protein
MIPESNQEPLELKPRALPLGRSCANRYLQRNSSVYHTTASASSAQFTSLFHQALPGGSGEVRKSCTSVPPPPPPFAPHIVMMKDHNSPVLGQYARTSPLLRELHFRHTVVWQCSPLLQHEDPQPLQGDPLLPGCAPLSGTHTRMQSRGRAHAHTRTDEHNCIITLAVDAISQHVSPQRGLRLLKRWVHQRSWSSLWATLFS